MEETILHTDVEWEQNGMNGIHTKQGQCIATTFGENRKENALFICKAVNNHHKIVEILEDIIEKQFNSKYSLSNLNGSISNAKKFLESLK